MSATGECIVNNRSALPQVIQLPADLLRAITRPSHATAAIEIIRLNPQVLFLCSQPATLVRIRSTCAGFINAVTSGGLNRPRYS